MKYIITIARTYGSGGKEIGKLLAEKLGISYYCREKWEELHKEDGKGIFGDDESVEFSLAGDKSGKSFTADDSLFKAQSADIVKTAENGSCVFIGRCADYVLRDFENVIKVFIYSNPRDCMKRVSRLYSLNPEEAKGLISSMNKSRGDYYEHFTGRKWDDCHHYDICINSSVGVERTVDIIKSYIDTAK